MSALEIKTLRYWKLSQGWHGRAKPAKIGKALEATCEIIATTQPIHPLVRHVEAIEREMISDGGKRRAGRAKGRQEA